MNNLTKFFITFISCITLPACTTVYQAKSGPTSTLVVDLPSNNHSFPTIYSYDENASTGKKIWDGAKSLVYGMAGNIEQLNTRIPINANTPFTFY